MTWTPFLTRPSGWIRPCSDLWPLIVVVPWTKTMTNWSPIVSNYLYCLNFELFDFNRFRLQRLLLRGVPPFIGIILLIATELSPCCVLSPQEVKCLNATILGSSNGVFTIRITTWRKQNHPMNLTLWIVSSILRPNKSFMTVTESGVNAQGLGQSLTIQRLTKRGKLLN